MDFHRRTVVCFVRAMNTQNVVELVAPMRAACYIKKSRYGLDAVFAFGDQLRVSYDKNVRASRVNELVNTA